MRAVLLCLLLVGCASSPQVIDRPVSAPCLGPVVDEPAWRWGNGEYPGPVEAARVLLLDLNDAKQWARDERARAAGCR